MKKLLSFLTFLLPVVASAHDIEVVNEDGVTIYYVYTNNRTELSVSYRGDMYDSYSNEYSKDLAIPEAVTYNGTTYPVTRINSRAFQDCPGLTGITIPNSIMSIGGLVFLNTGIYENSPNGVLYVDKWAYGYKGTMPINTTITLVEGTRGICGDAFRDCTSMVGITIPNSVKTIGSYAFENCTNLTSVDIPNSVNIIDVGAFDGCSSLSIVEIPNSVTRIGASAFINCSNLTSVEIPNSVTSIGSYAFQGCSNLSNVYCYAESIPQTNSNVFNNSPINTATLHVPADLADTYKITIPWSGFGNIVAIEPPQKCSTPTISFANGKLMFECETEGVEYVPSISLASSQHSNQIELFSVYRFSVYAKKNGYLDSDVASVNIDLNRLKGDMNNDGAISIADAVAIVNVLLGGNSISLYYSVGTDAVTANNYTTANNAQQVSSLSAIPSTLLTVTTPGVYYILLPDQFEPEVGGVVYFNVTKLSINIPGYSVYRTASLSSGVQIKRVNVGTSGSQIDYE